MPQKEVKTIIFKVTLDNSEAKKQADDLRKDLKAKLKDMEGDFSGLKSAAGAVFSGIADVGISAFKLIGNAAEGVKDAFVSVAKESISLEDAMNGVKRTGGLTTDQIAELTSKVRDYSVETLHGFVSSEELAKALEIAGQAGIISGDNFEQSADSALKFAGVLTQAAVALDGMSLEESGEKLGRFHLTFSETVDDIDKAASVLNYFGNITNRSAGFILNLSGRFAENAKMLRLSEGETMALAAALGNLNMESEQSGTAIGRAMKVMRSESAAFAEAFQMDVGKFSSLIKTDASAAIQMFADQMAKLGQTNEGVDIVLQALSDLEMTGQGVSTALLGLGGQADNLRQYLADQGREWTNNTSLMDEFINSTDRTSQLWTALQNIWTNTTGLMGDQLLPVFRSFLTNVNEQAAAFRKWFQESGFVETVLAPVLAEINKLLFDGVKYVSKFVAEWAKTVDIDAVMTNLKDKFFALIEEFKNIDWAKKFEAVKTELKGFWEVLKNLDWSQIKADAMGLVDNIQQLIGFIPEFINFVIGAKDAWSDLGLVISGIGKIFSGVFEKIRAISEGFFQMFTDKIYGVPDDMATKFPDAVKQMVKGSLDLVGSLVTSSIEAIGKGAVGLMEGLASKVTGFFSNMVGGSKEAVQGVDALKQSIDATTVATEKSEQAATGNSWLPDLVSWTDKARNDVAGLTSAINQSAQATAQATAQVHELANAQAMAAAKASAAAAAQAQAIAAMNAQGDYIQSNYTTGNVPQGAADVFHARQRIAQKLLPAGQVLYEDASIGSAENLAKQAANAQATAASTKYGSGIQQIAPGVWSNIAREVDKASSRIVIMNGVISNVQTSMEGVANTAYKHSLFPDLVSWSDKAAKSIEGIVEETRSVNNGFKNVDMGRLMSEAESKSYMASKQGRILSDSESKSYMASKQGRILSDSESKSYMASKQGVVINYNGMNMIDESSQRRMVSQISNVQKSANTRTVTTR